MAKRRDLQSIIEGADKAARDGGGGWIPEDGQKLSMRVVNCTTKNDKDGNPTWTLTYEVTRGEDKGKKCRSRESINEEWEFITQRLVDNMRALGVPPRTLWEDDPEVACEMVKGKNVVGVAEVGEPKKPGGRPFLNFNLEAPRRPKAAADEEDEDEDEEEETPRRRRRPAKKTTAKKAAKKTTKKRAPEPEEDDEDEELDDEFEEDDVIDDDDDEEDEDDDEEEEEDEDDDWSDED